MRKVSLLLIFTLLVTGLNAQVGISKAKANFIYNFTKFFEWPITERAGDFVVGVLGSNDMFKQLENVTAGKTVTAQKIVVKKFKSFNEVTKCHVIFVSSFQSDKIAQISKKTGHYTLIVSDSEGAIEKGAILNFVVNNNKLQYEFSGANADKRGLKYHSRVSQMASKNY